MRIFVTVGNALVPFDRLLGWADEALADLAGTAVEGVCQHGPSRLRPRRLDPLETLPRAAFDAEMERADVVICHAGVGTLWSAIHRGHRPLVVARRAAWNEIVNDHQLEIVEALSREGKIVPVNDATTLRAWLSRYARGEARRGAPQTENPARLQPVARAIARGAARTRAPLGGRLLLSALAALGPSLETMRVR
jgi:UDP-N-acetylglucosamine transferase subunit ALG13